MRSNVQKSIEDAVLAIDGGEPVRQEPMPPRFAFGEAEIQEIQRVFAYYRETGNDPGYQGHFEDLYCAAFSDFMGGGYADAVATGTAALFVALAALDLPKGSEVLVSPVTDPGSLSAIILNGLVPRLVDSEPGSLNIGPQQFVDRISAGTRAVMVVHAAGRAAEIDTIVSEAHARDIRVVEDCSQSHGATRKGAKVGTYGDIAAFSTMYRKSHITGASGGVVFSCDRDLYRLALAHADRGKPRWQADFDDRDPNGYLFPALNLHTDELSCAVGMASLARLPETIAARLAYIKGLDVLSDVSELCRPYGWSDRDSPFYYPIVMSGDFAGRRKVEFARAVAAEGIGLNPDYRYLVCDWPWVRPYLGDDFDCPNARAFLDRSFNLYVNEKYGGHELDDTIDAITKVEATLPTI